MTDSQIAFVYGTYLVATISPGPSNMAVMGTAMRDGRRPALALAIGVVTGSLFWAVLAGAGLSAVLTAYTPALFILKLAGGVYLLYLAMRTGKSALKPGASFARTNTEPVRACYWSLYRQGVLMHASNPKAILVWIAIISLGAHEASPFGRTLAIVGGCATLGIMVFGGYAILFSTTSMIALYARWRRWIEGSFSMVFMAAGLKLLFSRS